VLFYNLNLYFYHDANSKNIFINDTYQTSNNISATFRLNIIR
jgi:hypothetical protein